MLSAAASAVRTVGIVEILKKEGKGQKNGRNRARRFRSNHSFETLLNGSVDSTVTKVHDEKNSSNWPAEIECVSGIYGVTTRHLTHLTT